MRHEDVEAVQAVELAAGELFRSDPDPRIAACADHGPMPAEELADLVEDGRGWVATSTRAPAGDVVGFLVVRVVDGCAHVEEVAVDPEHGRRGHATRLLETAVEWARENGL